MDALTLILEALDPLAGRHVVDIGCGAGGLARTLVGRGASVTGVDPNGAAVAAASRAVPEATFLEAAAERLPLPDAAAGGAVFLNSLHHTADPAAALREAGRVVRSGSPVVVVEPLPLGSYFDVLRLIDDETAVRRAAQDALLRATNDGTFACTRDETFDRSSSFKDVDDFFARTAAVDPERAAAIAAHRAALLAAFERACERDAAGRHLLRQPLRVQVLVQALADVAR